MDMRTGTTPVELGSSTVDVPAGGYYDRFRMNPDLDGIARDPAAGNVDFFRRIPKRIVKSSVPPSGHRISTTVPAACSCCSSRRSQR